MSVMKQDAAVIGVGRQFSLIEAGLVALVLHTIAYLILVALGLLGLFLDAPPAQAAEPELHFTFAPDVETPDEASADTGTVPGNPVSAPTPGQELPDPGPTSPPVAAAAASPPVPQAPLEEIVDSQELEAPSEGIVEGLETESEPSEDLLDPDLAPAEELVQSETEEGPAELQEAPDESLLPEADQGDFATLREPAAGAPVPRMGRPAGPSLDQRLSDFGRAVERFNEQNVPQQPRNTFEPDWSELPATGQAIGNLTFESGDYDWEDYSRQIYFIIWRAWHKRLLARADDFERWAQQSGTWFLDHVNGVQFTIERNGEIVGILLERASGSEPFDLSAVEGLDVALLPPLPEDFPRDRETVHVHFIGRGPVASMRRSLLQYKRAGWF